MRRVYVCVFAALAAVSPGPRPRAGSDRCANPGPGEADRAEESSLKALRDNSSDGAVLFLYGVFCALSGARTPAGGAWLWFFMGVLFSVITVIVLLYKNAEDRKRRRGWDEQPSG